MPVETFGFINSLNASNPTGADGRNEGDNHIRGIKSAIKATFTALSGATDVTHSVLNDLQDGIRTGDWAVSGDVSADQLFVANGTASAPSIAFTSDTNLGLYRVSADIMGIAGRLQGNGAARAGTWADFCVDPGTTVMARGATATGTEEYIEADGSTYNIATFPVLGALLGSTYGGNGTTTFAVPDAKTTGRYRRSRTASVTVGTSQSNTVKTHTHTVSGTAASDGAHTHTVSGTAASDGAHTHSGTADSNGAHNHTVQAWTSLTGGLNSGPHFTGTGSNGATETTDTNGAHTHSLSINSGGAHTHSVSGTAASNGAHTHSVSGTAAAASDAGTETRPETIVCIMAIKT